MATGKESTSSLKIGFYGGGAMGEAILKGLLGKNIVSADMVWVCDLSEARRQVLATLGVAVTADANVMLERCDVIFLAVKPDIAPIALKTLTEFEKRTGSVEKLLISICAGVTIKTLLTGNESRYCIRVMPNTPCLVGEAASAFAMSASCTEKHRGIAKMLMGACGIVEELGEKHLDAVTGLSGSGPAYVYMMIEAMADGGVRNGLPRVVARKLAAQTVFGASKMVLEAPEKHPAELRNLVESPGGTTIAGTGALENGGFRASIISAVNAATDRSMELGAEK